MINMDQVAFSVLRNKAEIPVKVPRQQAPIESWLGVARIRYAKKATNIEI